MRVAVIEQMTWNTMRVWYSDTARLEYILSYTSPFDTKMGNRLSSLATKRIFYCPFLHALPEYGEYHYKENPCRNLCASEH